MTSRATNEAIQYIRSTASTVLTAGLLTLVLGGDVVMFAKLAITIGFNVFMIPIVILTDQFQFQLWVWYIIVIMWIMQFGLAVANSKAR